MWASVDFAVRDVLVREKMEGVGSQAIVMSCERCAIQKCVRRVSVCRWTDG